MISGKLQLDVKPVPVREFIEHSVETVRPAAAARNITIDIRLDPQVSGRHVPGDRVRLEQVLSNLLTNAVKFSKTDSSVAVTAAAENGDVVIRVTDHGSGISPEFLPMMFERFRQDRSTIKQSGGLGLGLAIVRNLTELHGGTVSAHSDGVGMGSTFTVRLPLAEAAVSA
jgi:signal transduction histidine kinase